MTLSLFALSFNFQLRVLCKSVRLSPACMLAFLTWFTKCNLTFCLLEGKYLFLVRGLNRQLFGYH